MIDEHLDEALERAAEMIAVCEPMYILGFPQGNEARTQVMPNALEGWAEAIQALRKHQHDIRCYEDPERAKGVNILPLCNIDEIIAKFIKAMLGGSHG